MSVKLSRMQSTLYAIAFVCFACATLMKAYAYGSPSPHATFSMLLSLVCAIVFGAILLAGMRTARG